MSISYLSSPLKLKPDLPLLQRFLPTIYFSVALVFFFRLQSYTNVTLRLFSGHVGITVGVFILLHEKICDQIHRGRHMV